MSTLSEVAYVILRDAVNIAREFQINNLNALKFRLTMRWPGKESEIAEAITFWANSIRERYPRGVSRV